MTKILQTLLLASLLQRSICFTINRISASPRTTSAIFEVPDGMFFANEEDDSTNKPATAAADEEEAPPAPFVPAAEAPTRQQAPRRLDPLIASVTRVDPNAPPVKMTNVPGFGEISADGLKLLVPAAILAVVGFAMSIIVGFSSKDTLVDQLGQISADIDAAALAKTNQVPATDGCRGLCSSQDEQLESMRGFMEKLKKDE